MNMYDEMVARKGTDEIESILFKYFKEKLGDSIETLYLWWDGTVGQV